MSFHVYFLTALVLFSQTLLAMDTDPRPSLSQNSIPASIARELIDEVLGRGNNLISERLVESALDRVIAKYPGLNVSQREKLKAIALKANTKPTYGMPGFEAYTATSIMGAENGMGVELQMATPFHEALFKQIVPGQRLLDVGCAFGFNTKQALKQKAQVLAIDIEPAHLAVLVRDMDQALLHALEIDLGRFPEEFALRPGSFDLIIMGQVLHFLTPDQAGQALFAAHSSLSTDGTLNVMAMTIHCPIYSKYFELLKFRAREGRSGLCSNRPDGLLFPLYTKEINGIDYLGTKAIHPQDQFLTAWNLGMVGFVIQQEGAFSLGVKGDGQWGPGDLGANNNYFFMVAKKSLQKQMHCNFCNAIGAKNCAGCKRVKYCSSGCQRTDWPTHKKYCQAPTNQKK